MNVREWLFGFSVLALLMVTGLLIPARALGILVFVLLGCVAGMLVFVHLTSRHHHH